MRSYFRQKLLIQRLVPLILVLFFAAVISVPVQAASPYATGSAVCNEVEVVFLVDQSGSMGGLAAGSTVHPRANDPLGLRFYGPVFAMRWLGNDFVVSQGIPGRPQVIFRFAVINFGNSPEVGLGWTTLSPKDRATWKRQQASLQRRMVPGKLATSNLGQTNFVQAFQKAVDLFDQRGPQQGGCPRRAIIVLTDGEPSVNAEDFTVGAHMKKVENLASQRFPSESYDIYITGINDPENPAAWDRMVRYWKKVSREDPSATVPKVQLTISPDQIADRFNKILFSLKYGESVPPPVIINKPYTVQPYLQQICFVFFKRDTKEHLQVFDSTNVLLNSAQRNVEVSGYDEPIETLCAGNPEPGQWKVQTTADRANVLINAFKIPTAGVLKRPTGTNTQQFTRAAVEFQLVDSEQNPLPEYNDPRYRIQITATVSAAGRTWPISLRSGAQQLYDADFIPVEAGEHELTVRGVSQDINGKMIEVISGNIGSFLVGATRLVPLGKPIYVSSTGGACPPQVGDQMVLQYQTQSVGGNPTVLSLPVEWEAQLTSQNGTQTMAVQGPDPQGVYSTTIPFNNPGSLDWVADAVVREPGGTRRQLLHDTRSFNVAPVKSLSNVVQLVEPASKPLWWRILEKIHLTPSKPLYQIGRSPLGRPVPIDVEVVLMGGGQTAIDPATVFRNITDPSNIPLTLTVTDEGGKNEKFVPLVRTVTPGHFQARIDGLSLGPHEFVVRPVHGLVSQCGYRLPAAMQATIVLVENPFVLLEFGILGLLLALALFIGGQDVCSRRNPCKGYITVQGSDKRPVHGWYRDLRKRNRWRIKNVPPITGIREMEIHSTKRKCGRQPLPDNRVDVKVWPVPVSDQDEAAPIHRTMAPNDRWTPPNIPGGFVVKYVLDEKNLKN